MYRNWLCLKDQLKLVKMKRIDNSIEIKTYLLVSAYSFYNEKFHADTYCTLLFFICLDDDNRVLLEPLQRFLDCQHEYINASYISVRENMAQTFSSFHLGWR